MALERMRRGSKCLKDKTVLVFGAAKSGIGAARLLLAVGASPILYDGNTKLDQGSIQKDLSSWGQVPVYLGDFPEDLLGKLDLVVLSPGIPCDLPLVDRFRQAGLPIWGEIELAWQASKGMVLAVTGTNGKTTTTSLLGKIMQDARESVFVVGNIGTPYTLKALETREETITVAEISSFQLETADTFAPAVTAILNITEDHLNRHHTMEEYIRVKESITKNQTPDQVCVCNYEDATLRDFALHAQGPQILWFSSDRKLPEGLYLEDGWITISWKGEVKPVMRAKDLKIVGKHNVENAMAAIGMAYCAGVPLESIAASAAAFTAVPHRIEYVTEKNGVVYYNDSKGTNPDAAIKGIQAMDRKTLLIAGGYDKQSEYDDWIEAFDGKVRYLVLIGQTKETIAACARRHGLENIVICQDLPEAMQFCASHALPGEAVLLSPACASWGQFDNYEQRGDMFKALALAL